MLYGSRLLSILKNRIIIYQTTMSIYEQMAKKIVGEQEAIIGPLAWIEAKKVQGIVVSDNPVGITLDGDPKDAINKLVSQYENIFGYASREVCKQAVSHIVGDMSSEEIPVALK